MKEYGSGNPIQISVYDDPLIIWNAAQISDELPLERLLGKHPSIPHNPSLTRAFFRSGYIEAWGRGIEKIKDECKFEKAPEPIIGYDFGGFMITFTNQIPDFAKNKEKVEESSPKTREKTREKIIRIISENPSITTDILAKELGITQKGIEWQITKLKKDGFIERVGSAKGGHWKVKESNE